MIWECCGNKIATPFCSMCGKPMSNSGLAGLLAHIRNNIKNASGELNRARRHTPASGETDYEHQKYVDGREDVLKKWKGYEGAVKGLMDEVVNMRKIIEQQNDEMGPFEGVSDDPVGFGPRGE